MRAPAAAVDGLRLVFFIGRHAGHLFHKRGAGPLIKHQPLMTIRCIAIGRNKRLLRRRHQLDAASFRTRRSFENKRRWAYRTTKDQPLSELSRQPVDLVPGVVRPSHQPTRRLSMPLTGFLQPSPFLAAVQPADLWLLGGL